MSHPRTRTRPRRTVFILACASLAYAISQTMVIPALPQIQQDFESTAADTGWVMSAFFISSAVFTGIGGRLGDIFGKKRLLLCTLAVFGGGAAICVVASSLEVLIVGRVVMGVGGGVVPLAYSVARDELRDDRLSVALGSIAMTIGLGAGVGMVLGGFLAEHGGFHWSFVVAALISILALTAASVWIPDGGVRSPARVDWLGAALLSSGLGLLLFAISRASFWGWLAPLTVLVGSVGLVVLVVLFFVERQRAQPLIHIPTLSRRPVLFSNVASLSMGAGQIAASILVVQYAQVPVEGGGLGQGATQAGIYLVPYSLLMVVGAQVAGRIAWHVGARAILVVGAAIATLGLGLLAFVPPADAFLYVLPALAGLGISMTLVAAPLILAETVDLGRTAEANGVNTISRNVGQSIGAQLMASILAAHVIAGSANQPSADGFEVAFVFSAAFCAAATLAALVVPRRRPRSVVMPSGIDAKGLASRAVAASEDERLIDDVLKAGRPPESGGFDAPAAMVRRKVRAHARARQVSRRDSVDEHVGSERDG